MSYTDRGPVIPEVFQAIETRVGPRRSSVTRKRRFRLFGLPLAFVLATGTAFAATTSWNPFTNPEAPSVSRDMLPHSMLDLFGVLRRAQDDNDRSPFVSATLGLLAQSNSNGQLLEGIRNLGPVRNYADVTAPPSGFLILIPVREAIGIDPNGPVADAVCLYLAYDTSLSPVDAMTDAGAAPKARTPAVQDARTLKQRIAIEGSCASTDDVKRGGLTIGGPDIGLMTGLVPDGVAAVQTETTDGAVVSQTVRNNAYQLVSPKPGLQFKRHALVWKGPDGSVIPHGERTNDG